MDYRFSQAVLGFELHLRARSLSEETIRDYTRTLKKFLAFRPDDPTVRSLSGRDIEAFMASQNVGKKSLLNYHIGLSAMWTWMMAEGMVDSHILRSLRKPKPEKNQIDPLTETEIRAILQAAARSRVYQRNGHQACDHALGTAVRTRAIILLLLDTGIRASELCGLDIEDVDLKARRLRIWGKGDKERFIPFSARTGQALWKYYATLPDPKNKLPFFVTQTGKRLGRNELAHRLQVLAERAGVKAGNPHRFRHTFAINYLRNGGDIYTLQSIMGHSSLDMVRRYLAIAQIDLETAHRRASPVENWRL